MNKNNYTKTFLEISLIILCLFVATLFMPSCSKSKPENNSAVPQETVDTTIPDNNATEKPIETSSTNPSKDNLISKDNAQKIALDHAKISATDAKRLNIELDHEDGTKVYEVEFDASGYEYSYEINATTGEIVKFDKEKD